ncbi:MAG: hypothetical protein CR997_03370 [Acidobacteria bacterium]|nr:MAG: hypothetical protein CR997_03370 [Acidobacteriota bacterium]
MKILIVADEQAREQNWFKMFDTPDFETECVQTVFEANDLFLTSLAMGHSYPLVVFHHGQRSEDAFQLMRYWRVQEPSIAVIYICKDHKTDSRSLKGIGIIDSILEDEEPEILQNHLQYLLQGSKDRQVLGIKLQILEEPASMREPAAAMAKVLSLIVNQSSIDAAAFIQFTDKPDEPIMQITQSLDITDQFWLDELCENNEQTLMRYLEEKRMQVMDERYIFPIYSSRGWEGLLIYILKDDMGVKPSDLESLAKTVHLLLERVRVNENLARKTHEKSTYTSLLSNTLKTSLKESAQRMDLLRMIAKSRQVHELICKAEDQILRSTYLLDDIIELARIDDGMMVLLAQPVDLMDILKRSVEKVHSPAEEKNIEITFEQSGGLAVRMDADGTKIEQVFYNLLQFLVQNSDANKSIKIRLNEVSKGLIFVKLTGTLTLHPVDDHKKLFERPEASFLLDENRVSLYICKKFIEAHEGKIDTEFNRDKEFSFLIQFRMLTV